jgi:hypothetical protein
MLIEIRRRSESARILRVKSAQRGVDAVAEASDALFGVPRMCVFVDYKSSKKVRISQRNISCQKSCRIQGTLQLLLVISHAA